MRTFYYYPNVCDGDDIVVDDAFEFQSDRDIKSYKGDGYDEFELRWLVEEMASDYMTNHDGWETFKQSGDNSNFAVWDSDKTYIGLFWVEVEYEPTFQAFRRKEVES